MVYGIRVNPQLSKPKLRRDGANEEPAAENTAEGVEVRFGLFQDIANTNIVRCMAYTRRVGVNLSNPKLRRDEANEAAASENTAGGGV